MGPGALRALKILVWGLGAMIVLLTVVILVVLAGPLFSGQSSVGTAAAAFTLPEGARIGGLAATANRIVVLVDRADGGQELQVIDPASGRVTLRVAPGE